MRPLNPDKEKALLHVRPAVKMLVQKSCRENNVNLNSDDLFSACLVEISRAYDGYDPSKGASWQTYALHVAQAKINDLLLREMRRHKIAPVGSIEHLEECLGDAWSPGKLDEYDDVVERIRNMMREEKAVNLSLVKVISRLCKQMERIARIVSANRDPNGPSWSDYGLTKHEIEALSLSFECKPDEELAKSMDIDPRTLRRYRAIAIKKIGVASGENRSLMKAYRKAMALGLEDPPRIGEEV